MLFFHPVSLSARLLIRDCRCTASSQMQASETECTSKPGHTPLKPPPQSSRFIVHSDLFKNSRNLQFRFFFFILLCLCAPQSRRLGYPKLIENKHTRSRAAQTWRTPSPRLLQGSSSSALLPCGWTLPHCAACPACCRMLRSTLDLPPLVVSSTCPVLTINNVLRLCQMSPAGGGGHSRAPPAPDN